jgi:ABC-type multidrug transport system fused ATPase/permease subunit
MSDSGDIRSSSDDIESSVSIETPQSSNFDSKGSNESREYEKNLYSESKFDIEKEEIDLKLQDKPKNSIFEESKELKNSEFPTDGDRPIQNKRRRTSFGQLHNSKIQITWKNVTVSVIPKKGMWSKNSHDLKNKVILNNVSGTVKPGQFLAIIGASGAGKTTLLNLLAGRNPSKRLIKQGDFLINGDDRK